MVVIRITICAIKKSYRKRTGTYNRRGCIPNHQSIAKRPKIIDECARIRDWKVDTMIGSQHQGAWIQDM